MKHTASNIYKEVSSLLFQFCRFIKNNKRINARAVSSQSDTISTEQYLDKQQAHVTYYITTTLYPDNVSELFTHKTSFEDAQEKKSNPMN